MRDRFAFHAPNDSTDDESEMEVDIDHINCADAFFTMLDLYGGELIRDNFSVRVIDRVGADRNVTVRYRKNLTGLKMSLDTSNVCTSILPFGKDGFRHTRRPVVADYAPIIQLHQTHDPNISRLTNVSKHAIMFLYEHPKIQR